MTLKFLLLVLKIPVYLFYFILPFNLVVTYKNSCTYLVAIYCNQNSEILFIYGQSYAVFSLLISPMKRSLILSFSVRPAFFLF